jgi:hypothetical protein
MLGVADDCERTGHIVEGMASIRGALASVTATVYALLQSPPSARTVEDELDR